MKKLPRRQCIITVREVEMLRYIANAAIFLWSLFRTWAYVALIAAE